MGDVKHDVRILTAEIVFNKYLDVGTLSSQKSITGIKYVHFS